MTNFKILATAAMVALAAVPANAAQFTVTVGSVFQIAGSGNDFESELNGLNLFQYTSMGASISLNGISNVSFAALGSESGFNDTFTAGSATFTQGPNFNGFATPFVFGNATFGPAFSAIFTAVDPSNTSTPLDAPTGTEGFGIFIPAGLVAGDTFTTSTLYFGYDNQTTNDDDNHDDLIISATVPEPTTWLMMIAGFGLVGVGMRKRTMVVTA